MRKYCVLIVDRATKIPLVKVDVGARTKFQALRIVKRELTKGDNSYIVFVGRGENNG